MSTTPMLVTDTIGDAGRMLVTPYTEEMEVRRWLYAAYGSPPWLRANHEEETAAGMIEAIEAVVDITGGRGTGEQYEFVASYLGLQIEDITEWDSDVFDWRPSGSLGRQITATAPDGAEVNFSVEVWGDEIIAHFIVELPEKELGRKHFSTASTADWPVIERYTPRDEWPTCMWAGQHGPNQRHPAPEVQAVVDKAVNDRAAAFAESYRIILEWRHSEHLRNDWLHPNTVFIVEEWTVYVYKIVEDGRNEDDVESYVEPPEWLADLSDGFQVDPQDEDAPDTTDFKPYDDAEKRLLRKAGLPDSIVLRVGGPW
ncbi:hypothetical protein [Actinomyces naeslundii]|uniref:hypothetical protein n=1 Tax=Actinomyces naeslundii TaxID=1655 RepID=UPI0011782DAB|nr:hypothetical protein [Actinomyces naeslundii]